MGPLQSFARTLQSFARNLRFPTWSRALVLWLLGSVAISLFVVFAPALTALTSGTPFLLENFIGHGQLLPGAVASLVVAEGKLLGQPGRGAIARTLVGVVGLVLVAVGSF